MKSLLLLTLSCLSLYAQTATITIGGNTVITANPSGKSVISITSNGSAPFTPVAGYYAWWNPDAGTTIATGVSSWNDQSGTPKVASQATTGNQPGLVTAGQNGHNYLTFNGSQWLDATLGTMSQPITIFVVCSATTPANTQDSIGAMTSTIMQDGILSGAAFQYAGGVVSGGSVTTGWHVFTFVMNSGSSVVYFDGVSVATGNNGASSWSGYEIGAVDVGQNQWTGNIADIIIYDSVLSTANRQLNESGLGTKYGFSWP